MRTFPSLTKTPNRFGYYEIRWSENIDGTWRTRVRSTKTGDRAEAEAAFSRFLADRGQAIERQRSPTVRDVVEAYLREHSTPRGNERSDRQSLRAPLGAFGDVQATAIRDSDIEAYTRRRLKGAHGDRPVKTATIRREIVALQAALNWGSRKDRIPGAPAYRFTKPSDGARRDKWLTEAQEREILDALTEAPLEVRLFTRLGLTYGVRLGAMMDLRFGPQIDWVSGTIDFNPPGRRANRKRRPVVPMTPTVRALMEEAFEAGGRRAGGRVMPPATPKRFRALMRRIGYDWVTPHVLKHSAITLMLRAKVRPEDVAALTSTDLRTILAVYRHHTADELLGAAERRR